MDIVYILGAGSRWTNNEIRYSLRSLENLQLDYGAVWIIGEKPHWVRGVNHVQVKDSTRHKTANVIRKILVACHCPDIRDDFVLMNDDFYFIKPQPLRSLARRSLQELVAQFNQLPSNTYAGALGASLTYLNAQGIAKPFNYDIHYPMVFNSEKFIGVFDHLDKNKHTMTYLSTYGNLFMSDPQIIEKDFKVHSPSDLHRLKDSDFISSSDAVVFNPRFKQLMKDKLPDRSRYEKALH